MNATNCLLTRKAVAVETHPRPQPRATQGSSRSGGLGAGLPTTNRSLQSIVTTSSCDTWRVRRWCWRSTQSKKRLEGRDLRSWTHMPSSKCSLCRESAWRPRASFYRNRSASAAPLAITGLNPKLVVALCVVSARLWSHICPSLRIILQRWINRALRTFRCTCRLCLWIQMNLSKKAIVPTRTIRMWAQHRLGRSRLTFKRSERDITVRGGVRNR